MWPSHPCLWSELLVSVTYLRSRDSSRRSFAITNGCAVSPRIPGRLNDRRTPLGELNWIFTAITDTIAWNVLPRGEAAGRPPGGRAAESQEPLASAARSQVEEGSSRPGKLTG